jgi:hypothetical protein
MHILKYFVIWICEVDIFAGITQQQPYHFHFRNYIQNAFWNSLHL